MPSYNASPTNLSSLDALHVKAERKHLLEEIRKRRLQNAQNRLKHQRQAYQENEEYRDYQAMLNAEALNQTVQKILKW